MASKLIRWIRRNYDDGLVFLASVLGVFAKGITPALWAIQNGTATSLDVAWARLIPAFALTLVGVFLEAAKGGTSEAASLGKKKPVNLVTRVALGFTAGYTLTGLSGA